MKIRSITYFCNPRWPLDRAVLEQAGDFLTEAKPAYEEAGYEVQTVRLATIPFPLLLPKGFETDEAVAFAQALEAEGTALGFDYISVGPALPEKPSSYAVIPEMLAATENIFASGVISSSEVGISLPAARACAEIITQLSPLDENGFANLYFAALANVPAGAPFFPAAYHRGDKSAFALAIESADLAVGSFTKAASLAEARQNLTNALEEHGRRLTKVAANLEPTFGGIDFSLAPFPQESLSLGTAFERLGIPAVGLHGSLAAAALITDTIDRADFPRTGFSGLMLPVLEDATLAARAAEGTLTIKDMLLYSAVCGTGLDTLPLPGNTTSAQITPLLLDLAALAQRLDKPLTARLMPIPGKKAGDATHFDFAFFANSRVLALDSQPLKDVLAGDEAIKLRPRWLS
jgi:hypothetical protein